MPSMPTTLNITHKHTKTEGALSSLGHLKLTELGKERGNMTPEQSKRKAARRQEASLTVRYPLESQEAP